MSFFILVKLAWNEIAESRYFIHCSSLERFTPCCASLLPAERVGGVQETGGEEGGGMTTAAVLFFLGIGSSNFTRKSFDKTVSPATENANRMRPVPWLLDSGHSFRCTWQVRTRGPSSTRVGLSKMDTSTLGYGSRMPSPLVFIRALPSAATTRTLTNFTSAWVSATTSETFQCAIKVVHNLW